MSGQRSPQVYFIGAGPGDPELITVKGRRLIEQADLVLYAGSLVPHELVACAGEGARVVDSSPLNLDQTHEFLMHTVRDGGLAVRVHTGDPSLYGAIREQMRLLDRNEVAYGVVPGVTAAFAAAAAANVSFTVPEAVQSLIICRTGGRTPVPEPQEVRRMAKHGSAMAIYLSAGDTAKVRDALLEGGLAPHTVVVVGHKVGWPGGETRRTRLIDLGETARDMGIARQTVFLVLPGEDAGEKPSKLYDAGFSHGYRGTE